MTIVVSRTRHVYDSYTDFYRLVDAAEFPTCFVDEIDLASDHTYIFTPINGEVMPRLPAWRDRRCKIVWWNLERPGDDTLASSLEAVKGSVDAVWVSDRAYAALHQALSYVPVASHVKFGSVSSERKFDVCHLAYIYGRRAEVVGALVGNGIRVAPQAYGRAAQDQIVARSHLMLNMHQYDSMFIVAPIRFAVAASYAISVVSEHYADELAHPLSIARAPLATLAATCIALLREPDRLREHGQWLHAKLCIETDFGREVIRAVKELRS